jgi:hypothetical protein
MFGCKLNLVEKLLVAVNAVLVVFVISLFFGWTENLVENCWDKYETEEQAISHCEKQDG